MVAQRMGLRCASFDPGLDTPASQVAPPVQGFFDDEQAMAGFLGQCEAFALENEFLDARAFGSALEAAGHDPTLARPSPSTLGTINDKLSQREALARAGVPSPPAVALTRADDPDVLALGLPIVIKARYGGYDGKGTRTVRTPGDLESYRGLWEGGGWLAEAFVPFRRELAVMVYRSPQETGTFPTMVTEQVDHVCDVVYPADVDASEIAIAAVEAVEGYGLFGVELFELEDGSFQVNEIAPRPHNSGHYTLDWGGVSQFEQHVRLALGLPCVRPEGRPAAMANLLGLAGPAPGQSGATIGDWRAGVRAALEAVPSARVHWYGKTESRPGRKMGHINAVGPDALAEVKAAREAFLRAWSA